MNENERRSGIPGAGSDELPGRYSWRARLGFVVGGLVVLGFPVWLVTYESHSGPVGWWWAIGGLWWTFVAGCVLAVVLGRIFLRTPRRS